MFSVFIDADGLPSAGVYYRSFPAEPSPEGTIAIDGHALHEVHGITLLGLLGAIAAAAGTEVLIVCHAYVPDGDGLFLPMAQGMQPGVSVDALKLVMLMQDAEDQAAAARRLPAGTAAERQAKLAAWKDVFDFATRKDLRGSSQVVGDFSFDEAEKAFATIRESVASRIGSTPATLLALIAARRRCLGKRLTRLEFRACDLGRVAANLLVMKQFFGAAKALAPKFETFFHPGVRMAVLQLQRTPRDLDFPFWPTLKGLWRLSRPLTDADHRAEAHQRRAFHPNDLLAETPLSRLAAAPTRADPRPRTPLDIATNGAHRSFAEVATLCIWKFDAAHFRYETLLVTLHGFQHGHATTEPDWRVIDAFVTAHISPRGWRTHGQLPLAGLWNPKDGDQPFLLPLEPEYVAAITTV